MLIDFEKHAAYAVNEVLTAQVVTRLRHRLALLHAVCDSLSVPACRPTQMMVITSSSPS